MEIAREAVKTAARKSPRSGSAYWRYATAQPWATIQALEILSAPGAYRHDAAVAVSIRLPAGDGSPADMIGERQGSLLAAAPRLFVA